MIKRIIAVSIVLLLALAVFSGTGFAAGKSYPFSVQIIFPENNIDQLGYYHVPGTPGETITLQAKLINLTNKSIEVYAIPVNAYSGPEGILYQNPDDVDPRTYALADQSYGLAQYINTQEVYEIAPGSIADADIRVTVPDINAGTLLGGIRFRVYNGSQSQEAGGSTILVDEYLAIDTAIQIDLPATVQPFVSAGIPSLTDKGLCIPIVNQAALITENVSGSYEIWDSNDSVLLEGNVALTKMAPMTVWSLVEPWDSAWEEGDYKLVMRFDVNGQTTDSMHPFTVGKAEVSQAIESQQDQTEQEAAANVANAAAPSGADAIRNTFLKGLVIVILIVFTCILLWLFIKKYKKKKLLRLRMISEKRYVRGV